MTIKSLARLLISFALVASLGMGLLLYASDLRLRRNDAKQSIIGDIDRMVAQRRVLVAKYLRYHRDEYAIEHQVLQAATVQGLLSTLFTEEEEQDILADLREYNDDAIQTFAYLVALFDRMQAGKLTPESARREEEVLVRRLWLDGDYVMDGGSRLGQLARGERLLMLRTNRWLAVLAAGQFIVLISGFLVVLTRRITRRLDILRQTLEDFGRGNHARRLGPFGSDELGMVARSFDQMADAVQCANRERAMATAALAAKERQLQYFVEHMPAAVAIFDRQMRYLVTSTQWLRDYAVTLPQEALIGRSHYDVFPDLPRGWREVHQRGLTGQVERCAEDPWLRADGSTIWVHWEVHPWYQADRTIGGIFIYSENITPRVEAKLALKTAVDDLARSNAELERFAYVASHDLQEPLRKITNYAGLFAEHVGDLDEVAKKYLHYMTDGARRMSALIDDMLTLSRIGHQEASGEPLCLSQIVREVLSDQGEAIQQAAAHISIPEVLPYVALPRTEMYQLFANLFSNAIKFRREGVRLEVSLEAKPNSGQFWQFTISDNGVGIEAEYVEQVFVIFRRLHARGRYPGTGIGLAICKKVVEQHRGRIWVESQPGVGTQVHFTLPVMASPATC